MISSQEEIISVFEAVLVALILQLAINQAEDRLFRQFDQMSDAQISDVSTWFYDKLETVTGLEVQKANFLWQLD